MVAFSRLDVIIAELGGPPSDVSRVLVCWELVTQHSGLGQVQFIVERSLSPQFTDGEYEVISNPQQGVAGTYVYEFTDVTSNLYSFWRLYFYRIRAETPQGVVYSPIRTWETSPRPHELAIIERHDFVLRYLQGQPSFAFVERTIGSARCHCYDATAGRVRTSNCKDCLGTGRQHPFFSPIPFFADYNPDEQLVQIASMGEIQMNEKDCWFSAYPRLKPGDVVYQVQTALLWRIVRVGPIQPQGTTIQQVARLSALERNEVEYKRLVQQIDPASLQSIVQEWERNKQERMF